MAVLETRLIRSGLPKKGFVENNSHHKYFHLFVNSKKTGLSVKMSHGKDEADDFIISFMAKRAGLNKKEFIDLVKCPLSYEDYVKLLIERGKIRL